MKLFKQQTWLDSQIFSLTLSHYIFAFCILYFFSDFHRRLHFFFRCRFNHQSSSSSSNRFTKQIKHNIILHTLSSFSFWLLFFKYIFHFISFDDADDDGELAAFFFLLLLFLFFPTYEPLCVSMVFVFWFSLWWILIQKK